LRKSIGIFFAVISTVCTLNAQVNDLSTILKKGISEPSCKDVLDALAESGTPANASKLPLSYFGVGIGAISGRGRERVSEAAIVNGKVIVTASANLSLGPVLEAHALIFQVSNLWGVRDTKGHLYVTSERPCRAAAEFPTIAHGPFTMLRVGDNDVVKSLGVGWMMGFRLKQSDASLNIGLAYTLENNVKTLAKGFEDGQALPAGETAIRFRTGSGSAGALIISFGW